MKTLVITVCCALLCLLAGCGGEAAPAAGPAPESVPEADPIPARMREEPLPGKASALLKLAEGDELLDWCASWWSAAGERMRSTGPASPVS